MAAISGVSEEDMVALIEALEQAGMDAAAVDAIIQRPSGVVGRELNSFLYRLRRYATRDDAWAEIMKGPWADWPGVTG